MFIAKYEGSIVLVAETREEIENTPCLNYSTIEETNINYQLYKGEYLTPEEIEEREAERINNLTRTRSEVWRALINARMFTKNDVKALIEQMPEETPEEIKAKELARIDVEDVEDFHRGHILVNMVAEYLNITSDNLDLYFETGDYYYLEENN